MAVHFYKEFGPLGYLATYSAYGFFKDGVYWKTSEHYYQAQKFEDKIVQQLIIDAETPKIASTIGRDHQYKLRDNWDDIKNLVMFDAVFYKFLQNAEIMELLLNTGCEEIFEDTVKENYWGIGPLKDGLNIYGKILSQVRSYLREIKG